jgi:hypothetical protein
MTAKIDIANMALRHVGISTEIQDFDAEKSKEAQACRRFYDVARDQLTRSKQFHSSRPIQPMNGLIPTAIQVTRSLSAKS